MADVEIRFEREDLEGIVAVGTYLVEAMRRLGIRDVEPCDLPTNTHDCAVQVTKGEDLLSPLTSIENEYFKTEGLKDGERLACQARIERAGEIVVMTKETKTEEPTTEPDSDEYRKQFTELPLEKKIADLVRLEAITLGETFSFILNSPFKVFEKVGDVMAEFGMKLETQAKKAQRPPEHAETNSTNGGETGKDKAEGEKATEG
ncbi:MAG TPA: hypothetical protein VEV84_16525 [Pyrinomonadaceae bacterium]|nr:hypothetical protein [Pyrinomonadaceae bacterium]